MACVLQEWVTKLTDAEQCDLMSVLRGIDSENGEVKKVTKLFRHSILNVKNNNINYFKLNKIDTNLIVDAILNQGMIDSRHWYDHVIKASYIIINKCDNIFIKSTWNDIVAKLEESKIEPPHVSRMIKERRDLNDKIVKLTTWLTRDNPETGKVSLDDSQEKQLKYMTKYLSILDTRLNSILNDTTQQGE